MKEYHLDLTTDILKGPTREQIIVHNQWAATGLDRYHLNSIAEYVFYIDGESTKVKLKWDSNFSKAAMKEDKDIANHGGVAMAWFVMAVILGYQYVEQSEIGDGVDYRFKISEPSDDDLNFLDNHQYVEISGLLEETRTNKIEYRLREKHFQIQKGYKKGEPSCVIVTLFSKPKTVRETHK